VKQLEYVDTLQLAHPFVDGTTRVNYCLSTEESHIVMTGEVPSDIASRTKEEYEEKPNVLKVYTTSFFVGLMIEPKDRECEHLPQIDRY
jgi:poly(A) polymerase